MLETNRGAGRVHLQPCHQSTRAGEYKGKHNILAEPGKNRRGKVEKKNGQLRFFSPALLKFMIDAPKITVSKSAALFSWHALSLAPDLKCMHFFHYVSQKVQEANDVRKR